MDLRSSGFGVCAAAGATADDRGRETILLVEDEAAILAMTRRVLLVHNGRVLAEGDVREIRELIEEGRR